MASMLCEISQVSNTGEAAFFYACQEYLKHSIVVYYNREVCGLEFDFCLLIPQIGVLVVEVKGWNEEIVKNVAADGRICIRKDNRDSLENPRAQARSYRFALLNRIKARTGKCPLIFSMVCYPNISKEFGATKGFEANCESSLTFFKEDLQSREALTGKLKQAHTQICDWNVDPFNTFLMDQVRALFEPGYQRSEDEPAIPMRDGQHMPGCYSIVAVLPNSYLGWNASIDDLVKRYGEGSKVYCVFESMEMQEYAIAGLRRILEAKGLSRKGQDLVIKVPCELEKSPSITLFNWVSHVSAKGVESGFEWIVDGKVVERQRTVLQQLDMLGLFNLGQFEVEHSEPHANTLVRAGAGTGKTTVMIARIAYLCYWKRIYPTDMVDKLLMITFTNDAADNMRIKLKRCFQNYYLLTGKYSFLEMVSQVDHMRISTIHAYAKSLIVKLGTCVGYGKDLSIASGQYARRQILEKTLEAYIKDKTATEAEYIRKLGLPVYELQEKLLSFVSTFENKSVDISAVPAEAFGTCESNSTLHELLVNVLQETERKYATQLSRENKIFLGRLMSTLGTLVQNNTSRLGEEMSPDERYMFIDEFQDTDDVQIDVLQRIAIEMNYRLFVVGDLKQCIYRFRGAEQRAFDKLNRKNKHYPWYEYHLIHNFRTDNELLNIYQTRFANWGRRGILPYEERVDALNNPFASNHGLPEGDFFTNIKIDVDSEEMRLNALFDQVNIYKKRIEEELAIRPLQPEDRTIAILVRENWQAANVVKYGRTHNQLVEASTGGDLYKSDPALEMLGLLNALSEDTTATLSHFAESSFIGLRLDRLALYNVGKLSPFSPVDFAQRHNYILNQVNAVMEETAECKEYRSVASIREELRIQPVLQVLQRIYAQLQPWLKYAGENERLAEFYRMNVDVLFEKMITACPVDSLTINTLRAYLHNCIVTSREENCRYPNMEKCDISVQCLTIHKAKGLEYGYVVLPYASFSLTGHKRNGMDITVSPEGHIGYSFYYGFRDGVEDTPNVMRNNYFEAAIEAGERINEETRILYVAMTRAKKAFAWISMPKAARISWQNLLLLEERA